MGQEGGGEVVLSRCRKGQDGDGDMLWSRRVRQERAGVE
jgi:hypothetical protein